MRAFWAKRLREPSTWRGLVWLVAGLFSLDLGTEQVEQVIAAGAVVAGAIGVLTGEG